MLARSLEHGDISNRFDPTGNVEVRADELQVFVEGRRVGLTVREFEIFAVLAERYDRVVPRPEIYERVWGGRMPRRDRSVDVFVRKVRFKLTAVAPDWSFIHTHFGIGYRYKPDRLDGLEPDAPEASS
jgi:DNA-binding response OmpR family regulator